MQQCSEIAWPDPEHQNGVDPPGDAPESLSPLMEPGEVTVHELTGRFPSLLSGALQRVSRKGDRR